MLLLGLPQFEAYRSLSRVEGTDLDIPYEFEAARGTRVETEAPQRKRDRVTEGSPRVRTLDALALVDDLARGVANCEVEYSPTPLHVSVEFELAAAPPSKVYVHL